MLKKIIKFSKYIVLILFIVIVFINVIVIQKSKDFCFVDNHKLPKCEVAIIFGAGIVNLKPSDYLKSRLDAGIELYHINKVEKLLLSGDDGGDQDDEISIMRNYCLEKKVKLNDILIDKKGYNSYKTIVNSKNIFKIKKCILVTQDYHMNRAIYISNKFGIETYGKIAENKSKVKLKYVLREYLANVKAFFQTIYI